MENLKSEIESLIKTLQPLAKEIKSTFALQPCHYLELCVFFQNIIGEELTINEETFKSANSSLNQSENEEESKIDSLSHKVFKIISSNTDKAPCYALFAYLSTVSIEDKLDTELLSKILDKDKKGYIDPDDLEIFVTGFEDFIDENLDWSKIKSKAKENKINKKYLDSKTFRKNIEKIFSMAEEKIQKISIKSFEADENIKERDKKSVSHSSSHASKNVINLTGNDSNFSSEKSFSKKSHSKKQVSESNSSSMVESKKTVTSKGTKKTKKTKKSNHDDNKKNEKEDDKEENSKQNNESMSLSPVRMVQNEDIKNEHKNNRSPNDKYQLTYKEEFRNNAVVVYMNNKTHLVSDEGLLSPKNVDFSDFSMIFNIIFDKNKETKVHQIKLTSLLYDIDIKDFYDEFKTYEDQFFPKTKFVSVINELIQKRTSNVFKGPIQRYSLSILYQYMDVENRNNLSYFWVLGALIILTKGKNEDRINILFSHQKNQIKQILSGTLALYINTDVIADVEILSEIFVRTCTELKVDNASTFYDFIFDANLVELNNSIDFMTENDSDEDRSNLFGPTNNEVLDKALDFRYRDSIFSGISFYSIIDVTKLMVNEYSLLGQINVYQLMGMIDTLLGWQFGVEESKEKDKHKIEFFVFVEKYFDFSKNELFEMTLIHSLFILIFSGTTREKVRSIFMIHETDENAKLEINELSHYLRYMFHFMLVEMGLHDGENSEFMGKRICELISGGNQGISFVDLITFFDNINLE